MLMIWAPGWVWLVALALGMGLFDGCFISLIGPIAYDLCGPEGAAQGIGFLLGLMSMPMTIGPPLAGFLFDHTGEYTVPFIVAGIPAICGGIALTLVRCVPHHNADAKDGPTNGQFCIVQENLNYSIPCTPLHTIRHQAPKILEIAQIVVLQHKF